MKLVVKNYLGETVSIQIKSNETFMDLKERVEEEAGISLDLKDIALKGKRITETQRVMEYFLSYSETEEETPVNVYCAVPGCKNTKLATPDKVFFEFPQEEIRCHQWVLYCQRLNSGPGKKRLSLTSESTICSDHFKPDQFVKNTNTLLKRTAVPCVKMLPAKEYHPPTVRALESISSSQLNEFDNRSYFSEESLDIKTELSVRLCRLCATVCDDYILIFDELGRKMKIAEKINLCLPIEVQITDPFPKQICSSCFTDLQEMYDLADTCSLAQAKLINMAEEEMSNEDLSMVSLNEGGEEVIIGSSGMDSPVEQKPIIKTPCPLCKEGIMTLTEKKEEFDEEPSSIFCEALNEIDPLDLGDSGLKANCIEKSDLFGVSDYSDSISSKKLSDPIKTESNYYKTIYDTSDYDSQLDASPQDFKDHDPLKLDDCSSKSDNDHISECYSSFTSPLNIITTEDHPIKTLKEDNPLSPIVEDLELEQDFSGLMDTESENSNMLSTNETMSNISNCNVKLSCRICANEFSNMEELLEHAFSHSFLGFYQCSICVTFYDTKDDLQEHFVSHNIEEINCMYCDICSRSFKSALALASHVCKQEENNSMKCPLCDKYFKSEVRLGYHMKNHESFAPNYCDACDKVFPDQIRMQKHRMYSHTCRKTHCCEECGKVFKSEASMRYHQRAHQSDDGAKPYTCERCGKSFIRKSMLINHMTSSHKHTALETPCFTCKLCFEAFPSTGAAVSHMDNHHKLECMDESTYSFEMHTINRLYICEFCERCYAESSILNTHREQHPAEAPYECKFCDTPFSSADDIKIHRRSHVGDEIPAEYFSDFTIPKTYLCEYCERRFLNQVKYTEHLTVHYGPEPYQCQHCSLKFSTLSEAVEHRANHGDVPSPTECYNFYRPYECHYCNKTFAIEDALIKHIRMHTGEKPFICDVCGKGFSQSSGLYTHQKVHSSERPYSCSVCPRTFKIKGDRDVHVRKHSGDRPYKCEFCGKAFMTQHVYSQHRKIHTGERPYKCDVCGIAFRRSHVLTVHKRIHTGEKPNICDICGKRYRQKGDMLKHRRVQHGIMSGAKQIINPPVVPLTHTIEVLEVPLE